MTRTRFHKVLRDLGRRQGRTLLTLFGLTLGLCFVGSVVTTFVLLRDDLQANFRNTNPANITALVDEVTPEAMRQISALPGVTGADERPEFIARIDISPDRWMPIAITAVRDFRRLEVGRFYAESGAWPPPTGGMLIERDGRSFFRTPPAGAMRLRLADGSVTQADYAGYAFDPGQHQSRMEQVLYGYVTPATLAGWHYRPDSTRILITTAPAEAAEAGIRIESLLKDAGIVLRSIEVHAVVQHGHQFQLDAVQAMLAALAGVALIMCAMLIVNLIDSLMTTEQRAIGVMRALGARSGQITGDYLLGMGGLGLLAGAVSLCPSLWVGKRIAGFIALGLNFNLLSSNGPVWLVGLLLGISTLIPMVVALRRIRRAAIMPVRQALSRVEAAQPIPFADGFGLLLSPLPLLPRMAIRSLARKPRQALFTAMVLGLGLAFFITVLNVRASMMATVESVRRTKPFDLAVRLRGAYPVEELKSWAGGFPEIRPTEFWSTVGSSLHANGRRISNPAPIMAVPADTQSLRPDLIAGRWLAPGQPDGIVVNQALLNSDPAIRLGGRYQLHVGEKTADVTILGVVKEFNPPAAYAIQPFIDTLLVQSGRSNLMVITLETSTIKAQQLVAARMDHTPIGVDRQITGISATRSLESVILGHLAPLSQLLGLVAGIALLVGAMGLASSISVSVVERFREIGVLKAVGGRARAIAILFMAEALFIGLIGWVFALVVTPVLSRPAANIFGTSIIQYAFDYRSDPMGMAVALGVAALVALAASMMPIRAAIRTSIYLALRSE
jgi:ABC-type antimicrobial peptide transport system permease subunit